MCHRARHMPFYRARGNAINCGDLVLRHIFQSKYQEKRARQLGERRNGGFQSLEFGSTDDDAESVDRVDLRILHSPHDFQKLRLRPVATSAVGQKVGRDAEDIGRSEERSAGKECGRTCKFRWTPYHSTNKKI